MRFCGATRKKWDKESINFPGSTSELNKNVQLGVRTSVADPVFLGQSDPDPKISRSDPRIRNLDLVKIGPDPQHWTKNSQLQMDFENQPKKCPSRKHCSNISNYYAAPGVPVSETFFSAISKFQSDCSFENWKPLPWLSSYLCTWTLNHLWNFLTKPKTNFL